MFLLYLCMKVGMVFVMCRNVCEHGDVECVKVVSEERCGW